jgi:hypothetical protein
MRLQCELRARRDSRCFSVSYYLQKGVFEFADALKQVRLNGPSKTAIEYFFGSLYIAALGESYQLANDCLHIFNGHGGEHRRSKSSDLTAKRIARAAAVAFGEAPTIVTRLFTKRFGVLVHALDALRS